MAQLPEATQRGEVQTERGHCAAVAVRYLLTVSVADVEELGIAVRARP